MYLFKPFEFSVTWSHRFSFPAALAAPNAFIPKTSAHAPISIQPVLNSSLYMCRSPRHMCVFSTCFFFFFCPSIFSFTTRAKRWLLHWDQRSTTSCECTAPRPNNEAHGAPCGLLQPTHCLPKQASPRRAGFCNARASTAAQKVPFKRDVINVWSNKSIDFSSPRGEPAERHPTNEQHPIINTARAVNPPTPHTPSAAKVGQSSTYTWGCCKGRRKATRIYQHCPRTRTRTPFMLYYLQGKVAPHYTHERIC